MVASQSTNLIYRGPVSVVGSPEEAAMMLSDEPSQLPSATSDLSHLSGLLNGDKPPSSLC